MPDARHLLVALAGAALVVAGGTPASAARLAVDDPTGDVWSPDAGGPTDEGSVTNADLVRTSVHHRSRSVVIRARYADLARSDEGELTLDASLRTPDTRRTVHVALDPGGEWTHVEAGRHCDGARAAADFPTDQVVVRIPRSCLERPDWVRYQLRHEWYVEEEGLYVDHATAEGAAPPTWSSRIRHGSPTGG